MKKLMTSFILCAFFLTLSPEVMAGDSRVDTILRGDEQLVLNNIETKQKELKQLKNDLKDLNNHLRTLRGHNVFLRVDKVAGSIVVVGIVIASYKAYFPPGLRAMVSAYVTIKGLNAGLIRLSEKEVNSVLIEIVKLQKMISDSENLMRLEVRRYCKEGANHPLCYK